jgi:hypothetical protein
MRDSNTGLACILKGILIETRFTWFLLIGICLIPFALAQRTTWRPPANIITVTNLNDSGPSTGSAVSPLVLRRVQRPGERHSISNS